MPHCTMQNDCAGLANPRGGCPCGKAERFDRLIVVTCSEEQRVARFAARQKIDVEAARKEVTRRMAAQLPDPVDFMKLREYFAGIEVCQVRARLKAASLLAICAFLVLLVLPAIDLPETNFDEPNTPTNEMVVQEQSACLGCISSLTAFVPRLFAHTRKTRVSNTPSVRPAELSYSPYSKELLCTLRC